MPFLSIKGTPIFQGVLYKRRYSGKVSRHIRYKIIITHVWR
nr:MAG TPA: hypothetical protein [Caudoviricetes sp.]